MANLVPCPKCTGFGFTIRDTETVYSRVDQYGSSVETDRYVAPSDDQEGEDLSDFDPKACDCWFGCVLCESPETDLPAELSLP